MDKREVKPFIDSGVKDTIYKISFVTGYSIKSICEDLCNHAFKSGLGYELSPYFKRELSVDGIMFQANQKAEKFESSKVIERISMTLNAEAYEYAYQLAYAMSCSVAKIVAYGVEKSMNDFDFLNNYINEFLIKSFDKELKDIVLDIVNCVNDDSVEEYGVASLLLYIADEYKRFNEGIEGVLKDAVGNEN